MRVFVSRTDHSAAFRTLSRNTSNGEIISNTDMADKTTVYRPRLSPAKDDQVDEQGGIPAKNDKIVKRIGNKIGSKGKRYTGEEKVWHVHLCHTRPLVTVRKQLNDDLLRHAECQKMDFEPCAKGKHRCRFKGSLTSTARIGRLHCDTKGQVKCISDDGHKYFITIVDEYSCFAYACLIRTKYEESEIVLR